MQGSVEDITLQHQVCRPCVQGEKKSSLVFTLTQQLHRAENQGVVRLVWMALEFGLL